MADLNMTEQQVDSVVLGFLEKHSETVEVEPKVFLDLLKHSLSLNLMEKKRVIDAVPTLSQFQFDELAKVFTEERTKFRELAKEHPEDIKKLLAKQQAEWMQLGDLYTAEAAKNEVEDANKAKEDEIKKSLGL
ncbi:hypothetical protein OAN96_00105 [Candidatus Gracilibacteria bacterium]|nr:hypothetical protein [Candidatus Gracilibacteria bacterium]